MKTDSTYLPLQVQRVGEGVYNVIDGNGNFFAKTYSSTDARLIAAAPELLEALKAVCDAYGCECLEPTGHCPMCQGRVAISKATATR